MKSKSKHKAVGDWKRVAPGLYRRALADGVTEMKTCMEEIPRQYRERFAAQDSMAASGTAKPPGSLSTVNPIWHTENPDRWWERVVNAVDDVEPVYDYPPDVRLKKLLDRLEGQVDAGENQNAGPVGKSSSPTISDPLDAAILRFLSKQGTIPTTQEELQHDLRLPRLGQESRLSRNTIGKRLKSLRDAGWIHRPNGERRGDAITDAGRDALSRLDSSKH